ncbi:Hypothetical protein PBC10988_23500 [Planctomycetales bacterium 10988]|nr:Hypothetical protein PBC10988_23500 [Planctomycetales bacterium 10988]
MLVWRKFFLCFSFLLFAQSVQAIDSFDRHDEHMLKQRIETIEAVPSMTSGQSASLQPLGPEIHSPCLVVKTNSGNLAKILVSWGFRKDAAGKPIPVLMIDRFITYDREVANRTVANGKNIMLFPDFTFNLDLGQVVPNGQGADLTFTSDRKLASIQQAKIFPIDGPAEDDQEYRNVFHENRGIQEGVEPEDFTGIWRVNGDGRWKGSWEIIAQPNGRISGKYYADETESIFPITGKVSGSPHHISLEIELTVATQQIEAYLLTKDKDKMAGTISILGQTFGIYAERESRE